MQPMPEPLSLAELSERTRCSFKQKACWVIKIGSAILTNDGKGLNTHAIQNWVNQIAQLRATGQQVLLVSSGSIAEGITRLGWHSRPNQVDMLQAAAAVGQMGLVHAYQSAFNQHQTQTAQILLTAADLSNRDRYLNARAALRQMLKLGVVPIINENDTVITDEIRLGDNDTLSALVANLIEADLLILLTDQQGLFAADPRKDPNAQQITSAYAEDSSLLKLAGTGSALGRGGMITKIKAGQLAARSGAHTLIAGGLQKDILLRIKQGEQVGSLLLAKAKPLAARKQWIAGQLSPKGKLVLDAGAVLAITHKGKSLLPIGIIKISGKFRRGEVVDCLDTQGNLVAKGLVNYNHEQAQNMLQHSSKDLKAKQVILDAEEMIHRDHLVII